MTVLSLQWLTARPRRRAAAHLAMPRHLNATRRRQRPSRHAYRDPFFADPAQVEDDTRRMTPPAASAP